MAHNQLPRPRNRTTLIPKIRMLEQNPRILLMDTDRILDRLWLTRTIHKLRIHVVNRTFTITSQRE